VNGSSRRQLATSSSSSKPASSEQTTAAKKGGLVGDAAAASTIQTHTATWVDEDEALSLDPRDYAFDQDDSQDQWERLAGVSDNPLMGSRSGAARGHGRAKERLAKKFPIEHADEDEEDEDEDNLPGLGGGRRLSAAQQQQQQQGQEGEEEREDLTPLELRHRAKEEEKEKKWTQIINPLKDDLEAQISAGKHVPLWNPHVDEYDGDGYDDYARTLQGAWEDDSPFHRDYEYNEKEFKNHFAFSVSGNQHILNVGRHTKTTKAGRVFSYSATVIDGNGNGRAGWGYGKGPTMSDAVLAAQKDCEKNSFYIDRYKGHCITESIRFSYKKCSVELFALPEGRVHPTSSQVMQLVFNAFGLKYVAGKWLGSTNKTKRIKTLFMALQQVEHPDYLSEKLGMKLFKPRKVPRKNGRVWTYD